MILNQSRPVNNVSALVDPTVIVRSLMAIVALIRLSRSVL